MSNKKVKMIRTHRYSDSLYGEKFGYIETECFSSRKERNSWVKNELKDLKENEEIYAKEEKRKSDSYFAILYDYSGIKTP